MRSNDKQRALAWIAAISLCASACAKKGGEEAGSAEVAAGGEAPGAAAPGTPSAAQPSAPATAGAPAAPANPWGSPDAEKGTPLPARNPISGSAKSDYEDGLKAAHRGDFADARNEFDAAVKADPNAYQALHALGVLSDREGKESQAIDYYRRALRAQADYEASAKGIVAIYLRQGQSDKALSFMQPLAQQWERNLYLQAYYADLLV
jgi:tetratricopeptide (TPR) repeat protein